MRRSSDRDGESRQVTPGKVPIAKERKHRRAGDDGHRHTTPGVPSRFWTIAAGAKRTFAWVSGAARRYRKRANRPPSGRVIRHTPQMTEDARHYDVSVIAGEELGNTGCIVLHANGEMEPATAATKVASGGAGVVYRAQSREGMEVAVKLLSPTRQLVEAVDSKVFQETFEREISILSRVTHTRVAKILFSGTVKLHGNDIPFYAMEFIEGGEPLDDFFERAGLDGVTFLDVVDQVLDGVEHLHARRIMHADLKGANVLVRTQYGHLDAKILDLGVAKALPQVATPRARHRRR